MIRSAEPFRAEHPVMTGCRFAAGPANSAMARPRPGHLDPHQFANDAIPVTNNPLCCARSPQPLKTAAMSLAAAALLCCVVTAPVYAVSNPAELLPDRAQELRADGLKLAIFRQVQQNGQWVDAPVDPTTVAQIEDKLLARARELRATQPQS